MSNNESLLGKTDLPCVATGNVRPSRHSYGFLSLIDGSDAFLPPDQMKLCFPGDSVQARIQLNPQGKRESILQSLNSSGLDTFYAKIRVRSGVATATHENPSIRHAFTITNPESFKLRTGDTVFAKLVGHPLRDKSASLEIIRLVANEREASYPWRVAMDRHSINYPENQSVSLPEESAKDLLLRGHVSAPFITIDGENTKDIDDAIYAVKTQSGFKLMVAIADPAEIIHPGSPLDVSAKLAGFTAYLPGSSVHMLPSDISEGICSLAEGLKRNALVASINFDLEGNVIDTAFRLSTIKSEAKLSYAAVDAIMEGKPSTLPKHILDSISALDELTTILQKKRRQQGVFYPQAPFYQLCIDGFEVKSIERLVSGPSQRLVEEAMVAANTAFGQLMRNSNMPCLYRVSPGFKKVLVPKLTQILVELGIYQGEDLNTPTAFRAIMARADTLDQSRPGVRALINRFVDKTQHSVEPGHHAIMGIDAYATFTSPLRKYSDLVNHQSLKALLTDAKAPYVDSELAKHLDQRARDTSSASREVRNEVLLRYYRGLDNHEEIARIQTVFPSGISVTLEDTGLTCFVPASDLGAKNEYRKVSQDGMCLTVGSRQFSIGETVRVRVERVLLREQSLALTVRKLD